MIQLNKKLSVGLSLSYISLEQWECVLKEYSSYIHDVYFSPIEDLRFQTRRNTYNFKKSTSEERSEALSCLIKLARELGIKTKLVLNVPDLIDNLDDNVKQYIVYKERYSIDYVTTFIKAAKEIKRIDPEAKIICSYNQGITSVNMLKRFLEQELFYAIVLGGRFLRHFNAYKLVKDFGVKTELLVNNACMLNCGSFCSTYGYCENNFTKNLCNKGITYLYGETSLLPEELSFYYFPSELIDIYKLSTRPCGYWELSHMLESYTKGSSIEFLKNDVRSYHLYGRLAFLIKYYEKIDLKEMLDIKTHIWSTLGFDGTLLQGLWSSCATGE